MNEEQTIDEEAEDHYQPPAVEDVDTGAGPAVTSAGTDFTIV